MRNPENAERICELLAEGYTLRQVAREIGISSASSITDWVREDDSFAARYTRAMDVRWDRMAEELVEIADDGSNDWLQREEKAGEIATVPDHEHVNRSRLRVDARKWLLSKMAPKKYGERVVQEHTGPDGGPIAVDMTVEARQARARAILDAAFGSGEE